MQTQFQLSVLKSNLRLRGGRHPREGSFLGGPSGSPSLFGRHRTPPIVIGNYSKSSVFCQVSFLHQGKRNRRDAMVTVRAAATSTERWFSKMQDTTSPESAQIRLSQIVNTVTFRACKSDTRGLSKNSGIQNFESIARLQK